MATDTVQLSPRVPADVADALKALGGTPNEGARAVVGTWMRRRDTFPRITGAIDSLDYVLGAHAALLRHTLRALRGRFQAHELRLILDALNGCLISPEVAGQHLQIEVHDGIDLSQLDSKHQVNRAALLAQIAALTLWERHCVELWAAEWWATEGDGAERVFRQLCEG